MNAKTVLISGAGIGGPTLAFWLKAAGFEPTVIEHAPALRSGGYVIDFWGLGYDIAERMGLVGEIARIGYRMRELREKLNRGVFCSEEPWPYMPHLTIAKMDTMDEAEKLLKVSRDRWESYAGPRTVRIAGMTLVKGTGERWVDVAKTPLGGVTVK